MRAELWHRYDNGGAQNVAAYLAAADLSSFNTKAPPPKTEAFWAIIDTSRAPEDAEHADVLDALGIPMPSRWPGYNPASPRSSAT